MSFRAFLRVIILEVILSFLVFLAVLTYVDPNVSGLAGQGLFYGSVFFFVSGIFVALLSWMRGRTSNTKELPEKLGVSFRQGVFLGILAVVILMLQHFHVLVWWVVILTGILFLFLEGVFLMKSKT